MTLKRRRKKVEMEQKSISKAISSTKMTKPKLYSVEPTVMMPTRVKVYLLDYLVVPRIIRSLVAMHLLTFALASLMIYTES